MLIYKSVLTIESLQGIFKSNKVLATLEADSLTSELTWKFKVIDKVTGVVENINMETLEYIYSEVISKYTIICDLNDVKSIENRRILASQIIDLAEIGDERVTVKRSCNKYKNELKLVEDKELISWLGVQDLAKLFE